MQILLTHGEVGEAVKNLIAERVAMAKGETIQVYLTEDGATVSILQAGEQPEPSEESEPTPTGERPAKKPRRTKAQIEADNKAEAERLAAAQAEAASGNDAVSTEKPDAETPVVVAEDAGETTQEQSAPGEPVAEQEVAEDPVAEDPVAEPEPEVDPSPVVDTSVAVDEPVATEEAAVKPAGVSLFANLRRPNNAAS